MVMHLCRQCEDDFDGNETGHECPHCCDAFCNDCADTWFYNVNYKDESAIVCAECVDDWVQDKKDEEEDAKEPIRRSTRYRRLSCRINGSIHDPKVFRFYGNMILGNVGLCVGN